MDARPVSAPELNQPKASSVLGHGGLEMSSNRSCRCVWGTVRRCLYCDNNLGRRMNCECNSLQL